MKSMMKVAYSMVAGIVTAALSAAREQAYKEAGWINSRR
jgi:hypothetical protein